MRREAYSLHRFVDVLDVDTRSFKPARLFEIGIHQEVLAMKHYPRTLIESVEHKVRECPGAVCFYDRNDEGWQPYTHAQFHRDIVALAKSLLAEHVTKGDRIGVMSPPCYEWEVADKAIMYVGAVTVGLDFKSSADDLADVVEAAGLKGVFAYSDEYLRMLPANVRHGLSFACIFHAEEQSDPTVERHLFCERLEAFAGGETPASRAGPEDPGAIIFTSGTTGKPKGIPFTQGQLTACLPPMQDIFQRELGGEHRTLAWVPLYNSTGRMMGSVNYYLDVAQYLVSDPLSLPQVIQEVNPTYLVVMPRLLEKAHQALWRRASERGRVARGLLESLLAVRRALPFGPIEAITDALSIGAVRRAIWGDGMRFLLCGSAPVSAEILGCFDGMGVPTYEVYGMSEIGVIVSMNTPERRRYGSVGNPLEAVDLKLADDGEILVKSPAAVQSYWGDSEGALFDEQGYFKTGDLGEFRNGFLYIVGRKKEIIKTSTGLRIAPMQVESAYKDIPGLDHIVVTGDGRKYLTALVTLEEPFRDSLREKRLSEETYLQQEFAKRHPALAAARQVKQFRLLPRPLSLEEGEITATLKVRRAAIERRYRAQIDSMYEVEDA